MDSPTGELISPTCLFSSTTLLGDDLRLPSRMFNFLGGMAFISRLPKCLSDAPEYEMREEVGRSEKSSSMTRSKKSSSDPDSSGEAAGAGARGFETTGVDTFCLGVE